MKKLALIAGAAALVIPAAAQAKSWWSSEEKAESQAEQQYTYKKVETTPEERSQYRIEMQSEDDFRSAPGRQRFTTIEGEQIEIDGKTAYKVTNAGERFFAPNGAYPTQNGQVVVIEDGQFKRLEQAPEVVMLDMNNDGR